MSNSENEFSASSTTEDVSPSNIKIEPMFDSDEYSEFHSETVKVESLRVVNEDILNKNNDFPVKIKIECDESAINSDDSEVGKEYDSSSSNEELNNKSSKKKSRKRKGPSCKPRMNNIRKISLKKIITPSGKNPKKIKFYKYSEKLNFLRKYFDEKETKENNDDQKHEEYREENNQDAEEPSANLQSLPSVSPNFRNTFEVQQKSTQFMRCFVGDHKNITASSQHPVEAFLAAVAPTLKTFTPYYLNLVKSEIFATVQKYDMKMIMDSLSIRSGLTGTFQV